eukprot:m.147615 g.147615  ORF g.147615 m.147615 type:complete len:354 (+) comp20574_c0_seq12:701-1762(+)
MRRITRREKIREEVRKLDAFPKVEPEIQLKTSSGALTTIVVALVILFLVVTEFYYYRTVDIKYEYHVDTDMRRDMAFEIDMTIAMDCKYLGVDYIDISGNSSDATKLVALDAAHFELAPNQIQWRQKFLKFKTSEGSYGLDSLERYLHETGFQAMPLPEPAATTAPDACRIHGVMPVNKIAANFHVTAGKSIHHARGHSHMASSVPASAMNFSHRIDRFSFSDERNQIHTLDGDMQVTNEGSMMFQYFLKVVPSTSKRLNQKQPVRTNQYSVTEQARKLERNAMGMPGVFFKYEFEAVSVSVREQRRSFMQFIVRLCGIVGGIFVTSGMLHALLAWLFNIEEAVLPSSSPTKT